MPRIKKKSLEIIDAFGDDFEVPYEEENPFNYKLEPEPRKRKSGREINLNVVDINTGELYDDEYDDDDYDDESAYEYDTDEITFWKRNKRVTPIAAPLKKSGKKVYHMIYSLMRNLSLILIFVIIILLIVNFLRGSAVYGDIYEEMKAQQFSLQLVSYFAVAACLILYELLSALWTMTKVRVRDEHGRHREDVGRGLSAFIFIYVCSYVSFLISNYIPELNEVFYGIKGALTVFGSMHNVLFGICTAGVISCLIRKYHL